MLHRGRRAYVRKTGWCRGKGRLWLRIERDYRHRVLAIRPSYCKKEQLEIAGTPWLQKCHGAKTTVCSEGGGRKSDKTVAGFGGRATKLRLEEKTPDVIATGLRKLI